jgi:hypothetical protein
MSEMASGGRQETRVHRVCSWCSAVLETKRISWSGQADVKTHGVCRSCSWEVRLRSQPAPATFESGQRAAVAS